MTANLGIVNGVTRSPQSLGTGVADSSTFLRGDGSWASVGWISGGYLGGGASGGALKGIPNTLCVYYTQATSALTANRLHYHPIYIPQAINIREAQVEVTGAVASSNIVMGVYAAEVRSGRFIPTRLVSQFGGAQSGATTGLRSVTGLSLNLDPGLYCLAYSSDAAVTLRMAQAYILGALMTVSDSGTANAYHAVPFYFHSLTYDASLPQNAPTANPTASLDASSVQLVRCPVFVTWTLR